MALLRKLWADDVLDYRGDFHRIDRAGISPLPKRRIPIWFGGFSPVAFKRAARLGDGFIFGSGQRQNLAALAEVRTALRQAGRAPDAFGVEALLNYQSGPERWREQVQAWVDAGADYVAMRAMALPRPRRRAGVTTGAHRRTAGILAGGWGTWRIEARASLRRTVELVQDGWSRNHEHR